ncbi:hypothetical protein Trydic_g1304 [Trypoxylus dichotomus]
MSCTIADEEASLLVETQNGWVMGNKIAESLYGWNGIPFAKPPLRNLRFELPHRNNTPLPVMVWVYGGGFLSGNSTYALYGPNQLVEEGTIVVTFNYRLGIFGFISTNDSVVPGNTGLKDQIFALKWVQRNIQAFGGDPNQITIFGESAGSASVSYLVLSPLTKGLFNKAVMESGTALCLWALSRTAKEAAFAVGAKLGILTLSSRRLINELKKVSAQRLQRAAYVAMGLILARNPLNGLVFAPVIEPSHDTAVVTKSSYETLLRGGFNRVPQLIGYNSAEANYFRELTEILRLYIATYDLLPARLVPASMNAKSTNLQTIGKKIKDFYVGSNGILALKDSSMLHYLSDDQFVRPVQETIRLTSKYATTYFYRFSYTRVPGASGAGHADELAYLFNSAYNSTTDRFIKKCLTTLWTNFAKYGDPTPNNGSEVCGGVIWKPMTPQNRKALYYIDIDSEDTSLRVETENGWVVGRKIATSVYGWNGIPFAKPPVGDLRFEPPQKSSTILPVMVWIHGGAFLGGNSSYASFGPDQLVQEGTVVVSFNYRLGIFGFISTNDDVAPGNAGIKDQILALKWVRKNIRAFGGDPNQVTIFGGSAGLFKKAIMESGSALCLWSLSKTAREVAFATGRRLGILSLNSRCLIDRLKKVSAKNLQRVSYTAMGAILTRDGPLNGLVLGPVIEPPSNTAAITCSSYEKLRRGDFNRVTHLIGYNSAEVYYFKGIIQLLLFYLTTYDLVPARSVPASMRAKPLDLAVADQKIRNFYVGAIRTLTLDYPGMLNYLSDDQFVRPIQQTAILASKYVTTYLYRFSYTRSPGALGASHGEELDYLFNSPFNSASDRVMKKCIRTLWTNFAKYGNPTPNNGSDVCGGVIWKPITPKDRKALYYIDIDKKVTVGENPNAPNMTFWKNLFCKYANPPLITY